MPKLEDLPPELVADAVAQAVVDAVASGGDTESVVARALADAKRRLQLSGDGSQPAQPASIAGPAPGSPAPGPAAHRAPPPAAPVGSPVATAALGSGKAPGGVHGGGRAVITEGDVLDAIRAGQTELRVATGTIVTALASDAARDAGLRMVEA